MKKCFYFPIWEEQNDVMISLDESCIFISNRLGETISDKLSTMIECDDACDSEVIDQSTPSDPILAKLCELIGAKWYGDYVVFQNGIGNIYNEYRFSLHGSRKSYDKPYYLTYFVDQKIRLSFDDPFLDRCINSQVIKEYEMDRNPKKCDKGCDCTQYDKKFNNCIGERSVNDLDEGHEQYKEDISNILQQYSLYLQGKENKWEEVKKILDI